MTLDTVLRLIQVVIEVGSIAGSALFAGYKITQNSKILEVAIKTLESAIEKLNVSDKKKRRQIFRLSKKVDKISNHLNIDQ